MIIKANTIIYMMGEKAECIYLIKAGKVKLSKQTKDGDEYDSSIIVAGDFFGLKEVMSGVCYEDTAMVMGDSDIIRFSVEQFEASLIKNIAIALKIIKDLSQELRSQDEKIHNMVSKAIGAADPEELFNIGEYYFKTAKYKQAAYGYDKYATYFPKGKYIEKAREQIAYIKENQPEDAMVIAGGDAANKYYNALNYYAQENYGMAIQLYKSILADYPDTEFAEKSQFDLGKSYFKRGEYPTAIENYNKLLKGFPQSDFCADAAFGIGQSYELLEKWKEAMDAYSRVKNHHCDADQDKQAKERIDWIQANKLKG